MKAVEAASATIVANGYGKAPRSVAIASTTGAISTAVAVFEMNRPSSAVITNNVASTACDEALPTTAINPSAPKSTCRYAGNYALKAGGSGSGSRGWAAFSATPQSGTRPVAACDWSPCTSLATCP